MTTAREAALDWVRRALVAEVPELLTENQIFARARVLLAVAEAHGVPVEALVQWIETPALGKQWSAAEWMRWCERLKEVKSAKRQG